MKFKKRKVYELIGTSFYNITASEKHNYVWFRIAKNGTRSVLKALEEKTLPEINGSNIPYLRWKFRDRFKFCFIRNPWDRLVSCYHSKVIERKMFSTCWDKDFGYFVEYVSKLDLTRCDRHLRLQTHLFPVKDIDYLAKFEQFEIDFNIVINERLNLNVAVRHENYSNHGEYRDYYSGKTAKMVANLYRDDISVGKYTF